MSTRDIAARGGNWGRLAALSAAALIAATGMARADEPIKVGQISALSGG
jgi:hypothetical protein